MAKKRNKTGLMRIGWKEWVNLPTLGKSGVNWIKAKIDTGARTSALHAEDLEVFHRKDREYARFTVHPKQRSNRGAKYVTARIIEWRGVRSSNGQLEKRPVIQTTIKLGKIEWKGEITLANRDQMGYRMLLGRTSLVGRFAVDCGAEFLGPEPLRRTKAPMILGSKLEERRRAELLEAGEDGVVPVTTRRVKTKAKAGVTASVASGGEEALGVAKPVKVTKTIKRKKTRKAAGKAAAGLDDGAAETPRVALAEAPKKSPKNATKLSPKKAPKKAKKKMKKKLGKRGLLATKKALGSTVGKGTLSMQSGRTRLRSAARRPLTVFE